MSYFLMVISGLAAGLASGLLGVGGGVILVPIFVYFFKLNIHTAIGTSLAVIIPTALMGALRHYAQHSVDIKIFVVVSLFAIAGAFLGAELSLSLPAPTLKKLFAVFLFFLSLYMYFKG